MIHYNNFKPQPELMERLGIIWRLFEEKNSYKFTWTQHLLDNKKLYLTTDAPSKIAKRIIHTMKEDGGKLSELISKYFKGISGDLLSETFKNIGFLCFEQINDPFYLNILIDEILPSESIEAIQLAELVSKVILAFKTNSDVDESTRDKIKKCLLLHKSYGDPRINVNNWNLVDKTALEIFKNWLVRLDLEFFFKVIFDDNINDVQERKPFWLKYYRRAIESRVIICQAHYDNKRDVLIKAQKEEGVTFAYGEGMTTSCFIMDFGKFYAVEFSDKGNALYIYRKNAVKFDFTKTSFNHTELRDSQSAYIVKVNDIYADKEKYYYEDNYSIIQFRNVLRFRHLCDPRYNMHTRKYEKIWHSMVFKFLEINGIDPKE